MKIAITIMIGVLLFGCSIRSKGYYMLDGAKDVSIQAKLTKSIGVENIILPRYFNQANVAIKESENRVSFIANADWVSSMNEELTGALIAYLKRYFDSSDIYLYPWDVRHSVEQKVRITIENFIYSKGKIFLDASWEIEEKSGVKRAKFFHTVIPSSKDTQEIVRSMNSAFSELQESIAKSLS